MTEEELKFYRQRQLEIHEERGRERQRLADLDLAHSIAVAKIMKGGSGKRPRSR